MIKPEEKIPSKETVFQDRKVEPKNLQLLNSKKTSENSVNKESLVRESKLEYMDDTPKLLEKVSNNANIKQDVEIESQVENNIWKQGRIQDSIKQNYGLNPNREEGQQLSIDEEEELQVSFLNTIFHNHKIIGQIFNTYIVLEKDQAMYLIDQHAAHERLLYNKLREEVKREAVISQSLLEPKVLELSSEDYLLLFDNIHIFTKIGFLIEDFGGNAIIVREVPMILGKPQNFSFIYEILDELSSNNNVSNYFEDVIIKKACKEAIKAKDRLDYAEIKKLIEDLQYLKPPLTCPHGRPIILTMGKYEIEKYFKRIQ